MLMAFRIIAIQILCVAVAAFASTAHAAGEWDAGGGPEWQKILAAAKREGRVVVAGPAAVELPFTRGFAADTGIMVEFFAPPPPELAIRLQRESEMKNVTIDVALGGGAELFTMYAPGHLEAIKPKLLLPGVVDPANWIGGQIPWLDNEQMYMLRVSKWVFGWAVMNSEKVDVTKIKTWQDLLKPEYKGKIAASDPTRAGPGQAAASYLVDQFSVDFVKKLYLGQEVAYTNDFRQLVEWAVRGTYPIILGALPTVVETFRTQGMKQLVVPMLSDGPGALTGGFGVVKLPKNVPHPNAAIVFINWLASKPGQMAYGAAMLEAPARVDAQVDIVPDYVKPTPGITYLDQFTEEQYKTKRPAVAKLLIEALGGR